MTTQQEQFFPPTQEDRERKADMNQQDQYNRDVEALAGTGKEPWTLWEREVFDYSDTVTTKHIPCSSPVTFSRDGSIYPIGLRRLPNADTLILQAQYEADMAVNPRAWEWWESRKRDSGLLYISRKYPIDWNDTELEYRRSPSAPSRTEWAREQERKYIRVTPEQIHPTSEPQPDKCATAEKDVEYWTCPHCGHDESWFDRSILCDGDGEHISGPYTRCNKCGKADDEELTEPRPDKCVLSQEDFIAELQAHASTFRHNRPFYDCIMEAIERLGKLPTPMTEEPEEGDGYRVVWVAHILLNRVFDFVWTGDRKQIDLLNSGLCHTTRENAQAWLDDWNWRVGR